VNERILLRLNESKTDKLAVEFVQNIIIKLRSYIEIEIIILLVYSSLLRLLSSANISLQLLYTSQEVNQINDITLEYLKKAGEKLMNRPGVKVIPKITFGNVADEILKIASTIHLDYIVIVEHNRCGTFENRGSFVQHVTQLSSCPILVINSRN
jgi:nucleotide-binding universal stress UspA family protein